ncbi:MAG: LptF/LptG family permease, partial [Spirochaetales bacterium]|nr:LptF/LptG family permease [Spirochaetales bacterium]
GIDEDNISDIVIIDKTPEKDRRVILADTATLNNLEEQNGVISLELKDIFLQTFKSKKKNDFDYLSSEKMTYNILLKNISVSMNNPGPREMSSRDVKSAITEKRNVLNKKINDNLMKSDKSGLSMQKSYYYQSNLNKNNRNMVKLSDSYKEYTNRQNKTFSSRSLQSYLVEYYKKFSLPFSCFVFVLFAFPVGLFTKRSGRSVGFGIGLLVAVTYWGMLFAGQTFGIQSNSPAGLAMWMPDIVIAVAAIISAIIKFRR